MLVLTKTYFYVSLLNEGAEIIDASRILSSLVTVTEEITSFPNYSILKNVTLYLSIYIPEFAATMTEEQAIQEYFDIARSVQRSAFEDSIYSLKKEMFAGVENDEDMEKYHMYDLCRIIYKISKSFMYTLWS